MTDQMQTSHSSRIGWNTEFFFHVAYPVFTKISQASLKCFFDYLPAYRFTDPHQGNFGRISPGLTGGLSNPGLYFGQLCRQHLHKLSKCIKVVPFYHKLSV